MKIAAHVLAYNVSRFIQPMLNNIAPFVDKIYVAYPRRPWGYIQDSRINKRNPTALEEIKSAGISAKLEIIEGDWLNEESMRNACFDRAKVEGFDWLITQDADEFYQEETWVRLRGILARSSREEQLVTTWYNFWKSSHYVLADARGAIKQTNAGFAIRCRPNLKFVSRRVTNATQSRIVDYPCYHYGYVMSDTEMLEKLATWSHSHEFDTQKWFRSKWMNWNEKTRNLHPTDPVSWRRAIRFPFEQPDFSDQFALPITLKSHLSMMELLDEEMSNAKAALIDSARTLKRSFTATFRGN